MVSTAAHRSIGDRKVSASGSCMFFAARSVRCHYYGERMIILGGSACSASVDIGGCVVEDRRRRDRSFFRPVFISDISA